MGLKTDVVSATACYLARACKPNSDIVYFIASVHTGSVEDVLSV